MSYKIKGECVYTKDTNEKVGCTKGSIKKFLSELHTNINESEFDWIKDVEADLIVGQIYNLTSDNGIYSDLMVYCGKGTTYNKAIRKYVDGHRFKKLDTAPWEDCNTWWSHQYLIDSLKLGKVTPHTPENELFNESEFDWAIDIPSPLDWVEPKLNLKNVGRDEDGWPLQYGNGEGETWVNIERFSKDEKYQIFKNIEEHLNTNLIFHEYGGLSSCTSLNQKGFIIHCGHEDNHFFSQKNHVCCMGNETYEEYMDSIEDQTFWIPKIDGGVFLQKPLTEGFYYKGVNPTVDLVVIRGDKVLLIQRDNDAEVEPGKWALPGGFHDTNAKEGEEWVDNKESSLEAAKREVKEETGLDVDLISGLNFELVGVYEGGGRDPRDKEDAWTRSTVYMVRIPKNEGHGVKGMDDVQKAKWVTLKTALNTSLAFDHHKIIEKAITLNKSDVTPLGESFEWTESIPDEIDFDLWDKVSGDIDNEVSTPSSFSELSRTYPDLTKVLDRYNIDIDNMGDFFIPPPNGVRDKNGNHVTNYQLHKLHTDLMTIGVSLTPEQERNLNLESVNESDFDWTESIKPSWLYVGQKFINIYDLKTSRKYEPKDKVQVGQSTFEIYDINDKHGEPHLRFAHNDVMNGGNWELKKQKELKSNYGGTKFTQAKHNIDTGFWIPLTDCKFIESSNPKLVGKIKPDGSPYGHTYCLPDTSFEHMHNIKESNDFDWVRSAPITVGPNTIPEKGDVLICMPGFYGGPENDEDPKKYGGYGYVEGRIIVVERVGNPQYWENEEQMFVVWPNVFKSKEYWDKPAGESFLDAGVYNGALAYYTEELDNIINESELDWVKDVDPISVGMKFKVFRGGDYPNQILGELQITYVSDNIVRYYQSWQIGKVFNEIQLSRALQLIDEKYWVPFNETTTDVVG